MNRSRARNSIMPENGTIGEYNVVTGNLAVEQRLENDVVAALWPRRAVPRAMESDEGAALVSLRELRAFVDFEIVRRPVGGKRRDRRLEFLAVADLLAAITAILWRQHTLFLRDIEIAGRPSVIGILFQNHHLFSGKFEALLRRVKLGPVLMQLIAAMLGDVKVPRAVEVASASGLLITGSGMFPGRREQMSLQHAVSFFLLALMHHQLLGENT